MILTEQMALVRRHQKAAPVDVVKIAGKLGLGVWTAHGWPETLSGMIKPGKKGYDIFTNANHSPQRRRYTIAHEIAHFMFHDFLIGDGIVDNHRYRSKLSWANERIASNYAAEILMPDHLLEKALKAGDTDIARLAEVFDVSVNAMAIRIGVPY